MARGADTKTPGFDFNAVVPEVRLERGDGNFDRGFVAGG